MDPELKFDYSTDSLATAKRLVGMIRLSALAT